MQRSLITSSISLDEEGVRFGHLRVPHSVHRSAYGHIPIPVAVAGNGKGPTILLTGGVHGDEFEGPLVLYKLMQRLPKLSVQGRIIIVPTVNHPAFLASSRVSPIDQRNLNRSFPGLRNGTATDMIAHYVSTELLPRADYSIDMHAGGSSLQYLPLVLAPSWDDPEKQREIDRLVEAFRPERVVYFNAMNSLEGEDRVFGNSAAKADCHFLTGEFGGGGTVSLDGAMTLERGMYGVLAEIGILAERPRFPAPALPTRRLTLGDPGLFAFAPGNGIFEPAFRLGDELAAGALAGRIYDPVNPWEEPTEIRFATGGLAVCIRTFAEVQAGDCIAHLAHDID
jgi:predicted deacylase